MIDTTKVKTTVGGLPVRIYATDGAGSYPIHGAIKDTDGWVDDTWTAKGENYRDCSSTTRDLKVERTPFTREVWVNVYPEKIGEALHKFRNSADDSAKLSDKRLACVKVIISGHEGDGL